VLEYAALVAEHDAPDHGHQAQAQRKAERGRRQDPGLDAPQVRDQTLRLAVVGARHGVDVLLDRVVRRRDLQPVLLDGLRVAIGHELDEAIGRQPIRGLLRAQAQRVFPGLAGAEFHGAAQRVVRCLGGAHVAGTAGDRRLELVLAGVHFLDRHGVTRFAEHRVKLEGVALGRGRLGGLLGAPQGEGTKAAEHGGQGRRHAEAAARPGTRLRARAGQGSGQASGQGCGQTAGQPSGQFPGQPWQAGLAIGPCR
jgi:hypothetical protein